MFFIFACTTTRVVNNPSKSSITGSWKLIGIEQPAEESTDKTPLFDVPAAVSLNGATNIPKIFLLKGLLIFSS